MAVALDTLVYHFSTNITSDVPMTIAANPNRVLAFLISISDTASAAVSSVTGAGATWSQVGTGGTNIRAAVWKGLNPTAGAQTVTVTLTAEATSDWGGHLYSLYDADQVTGVSGVVTTTAGNLNVTLASGGMALSGQYDPADIRTVSGCTAAVDESGANIIGHSAAHCTSAPTSTFTWSGFGGGSIAVGCAVAAVAVAGGHAAGARFAKPTRGLAPWAVRRM